MDIGDIGGSIAAIGVIAGFAYTVIRNQKQDKADVSSDIAATKVDVKTLETGQKDLHVRIDKVDGKIDKVADNLTDFKLETNSNLIQVTTDLASLKSQAFTTFVKKSDVAQLTANHSPINLTDEGEEAAQQSKIDQFIEKRKQNYFEELDQAIGDAEVFEVCIQIALRELRERNDEIRFIKDYFYNAGLMAQTDQIFALKLRDIYQQQKVKKV